MKSKLSHYRVRHIVSCTLGALALVIGQQALATDISNEPLATKAGSSKVRHNLMFILDNSGSMGQGYTPDWVVQGNMCRTYYHSNRYRTDCIDGSPPYYSSDINSQFYNPDVTYLPPKKSDGKTSYPAMTATETSSWTKVPNDAYGQAAHPFYERTGQVSSTTTYNIATKYPDLLFSNGQRNSRNLDDPNNGDYVYPTDKVVAASVVFDSNPYYYRLKSSIYCSEDLLKCKGQAAPDTDRPRQVKVLWCNSATPSNADQCIGRRTGNYQVPGYMTGYGKPYNFERVDITPTVTSYVKSETRTDCKGTTCTYDDEMTNFANWFAYYRTRMQTMKSAGAIAFAAVKSERFRVGFLSLHNNVSGSNYSFLALNEFNDSQRAQWYDKLFKEIPGNGTPLSGALSRVGRYYAGNPDASIKAVGGTAIQYACQKNFALLTTDGYWNSNNLLPPTKIDGSSLLGDSFDSDPATRAYGIYDGGLSKGSLADVAAYYYQTDLLDETKLSGADKERALNKYGEVPAEYPEKNDVKMKAQRMTTFTLGLGVDGEMLYQPDYAEASKGDFRDIINNKRNWPAPVESQASTVDDLWHAAVNGRGGYQSAKQPQQVVEALQDILNKADAAPGSSAAPTVPDELNPGASLKEDQFSFHTTFQTITWVGQVFASKPKRNAVTGEIERDTNDEPILEPILDWLPHAKLTALNSGADKSNASKQRNIFTFDGEKKINFAYKDLDGVAKLWFDNQADKLSQGQALTTSQLALANSGENLVSYLRGDQTLEAKGIFRKRVAILGDTGSGGATFWQQNPHEYPDFEYEKFRAAQKERLAMVYVPANDGMLHAFIKKTEDVALKTGEEEAGELWAYAPRMVLSNMSQLASKDYPGNHRYYVDGAPEIEDVWDGKKWRTILVGGLNAGGKGFYALDVTDPRNPEVLWEFCGDAAACSEKNGRYHAKMGLSFGKPNIFKLPPNSVAPGSWAVAFGSGYNGEKDKTQPGRLFVLDAITGKLLYDMESGGDGLAHIDGWAYQEEQLTDKTHSQLFGGDLEGKVWKFDLNQTNTKQAGIKMAELKKGTVPQPITTRLQLTSCGDKLPVIVAATGKLLGDSDSVNTDDQSVYVFKMDLPASDQSLNKHGQMVEQVFDYAKTGVKRGDKSRYSAKPVDFGKQNGWYMNFETKTGERVNISTELKLGVLAVSTNRPVNAAGANLCESGGTAESYVFNVCEGALMMDVFHHDSMIAGQKIYVVPNSKTGSYTLNLAFMKTDGTKDKASLGTFKFSGALRAKRASWREILPDN